MSEHEVENKIVIKAEKGLLAERENQDDVDIPFNKEQVNYGGFVSEGRTVKCEFWLQVLGSY
jgi:hypothetical protein